MWDKDIIKWNDCIAETILDLGKYFRRAYKKKTEMLKLFETVRTQKAKEALVKTQQTLAKNQVKCDVPHLLAVLGAPIRWSYELL